VGAAIGGLALGGVAGAGVCSMRKRPGRVKYGDITLKKGYSEGGDNPIDTRGRTESFADHAAPGMAGVSQVPGSAYDKSHRLTRGTNTRSSSDNPLSRTDRTEHSMSLASHSDASEPGMVNVSQVQQETGRVLPEVDDEVLAAQGSDGHVTVLKNAGTPGSDGHVTVLKNAEVPDTTGHEMGHHLGTGSDGAAGEGVSERLRHKERAEADTAKAQFKQEFGQTQQQQRTSGDDMTANPMATGGAHEAAHVVQQGGGVRAQDYNSSRSNTTSLRPETEGGFGHDLAKENVLENPSSSGPGGSGGGGSGGTKAQDYNSSRSNTTTSVGPGSDGTDLGGDRAKDYNSSRSNTSSSMDVSGDTSGGGGGGSGGGDRARDYNNSRSNNEYDYRRDRTADDAGLSKADSKRALEGTDDGSGGEGRARKSGNESSAISTPR
jgi:hypothetical protein